MRIGTGPAAVPPSDLPLALAGHHRRLAMGDELRVVHPRPPVLGVAGIGPAVTAADWVRDVLLGAAFEPGDPSGSPSPSADAGGRAGTAPATTTARRAFGLADRVGPGMRLLVCGLNPSILAAELGVAFARPGNRFWPALLDAGLAERDRDPEHALAAHGVGFTDLVKRPTRQAAELLPPEFVAGLGRVERLVRWLEPAAVCFLGVTGYRLATGDRRAVVGPLPAGFGGAPAYVAPNPSGLNAHVQLPAMVQHLRRAAELGGR